MDMQIVRRGTPPPPPWGDDIPYYWEGEEFGDVTGGWISGSALGEGLHSKEADHLYLELFGSTSTSQIRSFVTVNKINFSGINFLKILAETFDASNGGTFRFGVSQDQIVTSPVDFQAISTLSAPFTKQNFVLDVSALAGEYYIIVLIAELSTSISRPFKSKLYKVWGEE